ncbi:jg10872 [Pararge aegeria aegeria]|uniref:Jg10872 protein n=1 Tax=Pararge aegeria aegeria TaxID=348720 RepID=A0A8S4QYK3_9NEOP|nr:jg10872 [Pararge aegeria aegeria]
MLSPNSAKNDGCISAPNSQAESFRKKMSQPYFLLGKDVGISIGVVVLLAVFVLSSVLVIRVARRVRSKPAPVIQVLQLDEVAREYLDNIGEHKVHASCSLRSCSSGYSDGSGETGPTIDRRRKPRLWEWDPPPPDVTLTLHRESAV